VAQESHFSQVTKTPLVNNPANAAVMDEEVRVTNNYRNQWRSIDIPYNTIHFGIEKKLRIHNQHFGLGINMINDLSKSNIIATNNFAFTLSYSFFVKNHQFVAGGQIGEVIKNYDAHNLTLGSQFNDNTGIFDPSLPSGESNLESNLNYADINAGILWRSKLKDMRPLAGFSVYHINRPYVSFVGDQEEKDRLPLKYTVHGNILMPLIDKFDLTPTLYYSFLGFSHDFIGGAILGYNVEDLEIPVNRLYSMAMFRINPSRNMDAMILGIGVDFFQFDLGISYDFNVSSLRKVTHFKGAFEFSLIFKAGRPKIKGSSEPCYML
jgi:type IX secretion system PorP/SprF family membrane protein